MSVLSDQWEKLPSLHRRVTAWVGFMASVAAIYTMLNVIFDVTLRPTWHWEYEALVQDHRRAVLDIAYIQRREASREHARYLAMREDFRRSNQPIPDWLTEAISRGEQEIDEVSRQIDQIQSLILQND